MKARSSRRAAPEVLAEKGFGRDQLAEMQNVIDAEELLDPRGRWRTQHGDRVLVDIEAEVDDSATDGLVCEELTHAKVGDQPSHNF